ncbi:hypothetical protein F5Y13DRAFT_32306 [Hypoxylon sp. FL1857]|nr:hypothetical protein F5Y13DRAFT_32306 [Hypoxylon sp. FL1857]
MGYNQIVELLIQRGAHVNLLSVGICRCSIGRRRLGGVLEHMPCSALHLALSRVYISTAKLIIEYGKPMHATLQRLLQTGSISVRVPEPLIPQLVPHQKGPAIIRRLFDEAYRYHPQITEHPLNTESATTMHDHTDTELYYRFQRDCLLWLTIKDIEMPRWQDPNNGRDMPWNVTWHKCFSSTCKYLSYNLDAQRGWSYYNAAKPLIHVYLQGPYERVPNWRDSGASLKRVKKEFEHHALPFLESHIGKGADVNVKDPWDNNSTPLMVAARNGLPTAIDMLISKGANINETDGMGYTALHAAIVSRQGHIITKLVRKGAKINAVNKRGLSPLHFLYCTIDDDHRAELLYLIELLVSLGADPMLRIECPGEFPSAGKSALEIALSRSHLAAAKLLLPKCESTLSETYIWHLFESVLESCNTDCLQLVLMVDRQNFILRSDQSILRLLKSRKNTTELVMLLLDCGARCDGIHAEDGGNTVFWAVQNLKGVAVLTRLLKGGASPNVICQAKRRRCALLQALKFRKREIRRAYFELLVDYGADINLGLYPRYRPKPLYVLMMEPKLLRKAESVADILFSPSSLQRVSEAQKIAYMDQACRLTHVKLLQVLLTYTSDVVIRRFLDGLGEELPIGRLLDVTEQPDEYIQATKLTMEHMNLAITALYGFIKSGTSWGSRSMDTKRRAVAALKRLKHLRSTPTIIGAAWCIDRRITIANFDGEDPRITISAPLDLDRRFQKTTLYNLGLRITNQEGL